jgi:hypothetical protein
MNFFLNFKKMRKINQTMQKEKFQEFTFTQSSLVIQEKQIHL